MKKISLRPLPAGLTEVQWGVNDIQAYLDFEKAHYDDGSPTPFDHDGPWATFEGVLEGIHKGDLIGAILDQGGMPVATHWFTVDNDNDMVSLYIESMIVRADYRGQGLGAYMLDRAEQVAQERDLQWCSLTVDPLNDRGLGMYLRRGYMLIAYVNDDPDGLDHWLYAVKSLLEEPPIKLNIEDDIEILTGDEERLEAVFNAGYIGYELTSDPDGDPYKGTIKFAKATSLDEDIT